MIQLKQLLQEISLSGVQPYTTQFVWDGLNHDSYQDGDEYTCYVQCDEHRVLLHMEYVDGASVAKHHSVEGSWVFSFFVRTADGYGWTVQQDRGVAKGDINTLRFFKTIGLALRAFIDTHPGVDIIDITGSDFAEEKSAQKSRVYAGLIASNPELSDFRIMTFGRYDQMCMIRRNMNQPRPDASGIDTPGDPTM
jgi:hypothetical protein